MLLAFNVTARPRPAEALTLRILILDPQGSVITNARVQLKDERQHEKIVESRNGSEMMVAVPKSGNYKLRVEAPGFATRELELMLTTSRTLEIRLEVAGVSAVVNIERSEREKKTDPNSGAFTNVLSPDQIADLPDDPEEMEVALMRMAGPGAVIRVDGFSGRRLPAKSQIAGIRITQNGYSAEFHEGGVPAVDITTKAGAGEWNGYLSGRFRDGVLNTKKCFRASPES